MSIALNLSDLLGANASRNGSVQAVNGTLRLTDDINQEAGTVFYNTSVSVARSFETQFQFQITGEAGTNGADGIVFLLQNAAGGPAALGGAGGNLGYWQSFSPTLAPAVAIEFDTFFNEDTGDSGDNSLELIVYPAPGEQSVVGQINPGFDINNGGAYTAWISYQSVDNGPDLLQIFAAAAGAEKPSTPLISQALELSSILGPQAFVGFSASTGGARNTHDIQSWSFTPLGSDLTFTKGAPGQGYFNFTQFTEAALFESGTEIPFQPVELNGLSVSLLYDETYYLCQNPDVASAVAHGIFRTGYDHFIEFGWLEGRNPSILFDEIYYLNQNVDVAEAVVGGSLSSGFQHFVLFGQEEGRSPSTLFDEQAYLVANADVQAAINQDLFTSGFDHYIEFGAVQGRGPSLILFEDNYYLSQNPDVAAALAQGDISSPLFHYVVFGQGEQRDPSAQFDESAYLAANADVAAAVSAGGLSSGFQHYLLFGRCEGRLPISAAAAIAA